MAGNTQGNMMGAKPVIGNKPDNMSNNTLISLVKRLLNRSGLGSFSFGFDGGHDVYNDKMAEKIYEIERHLHSNEKWFGLAAAPSGETHRADRIDGAIAPFQVTCGNNAYGDWLQIMGSEDTPVQEGMTKFDFNRLLVTALSGTGLYALQISCCELTDLPAMLASENYTDIAYQGLLAGIDVGITQVNNERAPTGAKIWIRGANVGGNATTIDFYISLHEYVY